MGNKDKGDFYAHCRVLPGMFKTELYVIVGDSSAYVYKDDVRVSRVPEVRNGKVEEVDGEVLVYLIKVEDARALVELPGEAVVGGLRTWVSKSLLTNNIP